MGVNKPAVDKRVLELMTRASNLLGPIGAEAVDAPAYLLDFLALVANRAASGKNPPARQAR